MPINHTASTGSDLRLERLKRDYGWKGYGVYWGIVEVIDQQPNASISEDYDALGWILRIDDVQIIKDVVNNFGLFNVVDDSIRLATNESTGSTVQNLSFAQKGARASAQKRKQKKAVDTAPNVETPQVQNQQTRVGAPRILAFDEIDDETPPTCQDDEKAVKETRDDWNEVFKGTRAVVKKEIFSTPIERLNVKTTRRQFTRDEIKEAFQVARLDSFNWQFIDAIKPDNIRRLLTKKDRNQNATNRPNYRNDTAQDDGVSFDAIFGTASDVV